MKKILFIFGTRPETIKLAPVIDKLKAEDGEFKTFVCVTAQHRQLLDQALSIFKIKPDIDLNLMRENQSLDDLTVNVIKGVTKVLLDIKPDIVLVQGDTTTAAAASLASFYQKIPVGHVEAGLRTKNKYSPFPEEINRRLISVLADYHFAPTKTAKEALLFEGVLEEKIFLTGNTAIDALSMVNNKEENLEKYFKEKYNLLLDKGQKIILVTGHRRESFGRGFENICLALKEIAERNPEATIVYSVHSNPNVRGPVYKILGSGPKNICLTKPLDYKTFVYLLNKSYLILTDSGGIQEEAPSLGKPVLVMRDTTERIEGIEAGTAKLVGTDKEKIIRETERLLNDPSLYQEMSKVKNPYGDGRAAERIFKVLRNHAR